MKDSPICTITNISRPLLLLLLLLESASPDLLGWDLLDLVHKLQTRLVCIPEGITFKLPIEKCSKNNDSYRPRENKQHPSGAERHTDIFVCKKFNGCGSTEVINPTYVGN